MTPDSDSAHRDVDVLRHVHVDISKANNYSQRRSLGLNFGLAQIEIHVAECSTRDCPAS